MAKELNIDMELIRVKPSNNFANVNGSVTGGGMGSEGNCSVNILITTILKIRGILGIKWLNKTILGLEQPLILDKPSIHL